MVYDMLSGACIILPAMKAFYTHTVADPRLIFVAAIKANVCALILTHNHPSGNLNPSQADIDLTKKMREAGRFLEVSVLDHIIITSESYYSFADEGLI